MVQISLPRDAEIIRLPRSSRDGQKVDIFFCFAHFVVTKMTKPIVVDVTSNDLSICNDLSKWLDEQKWLDGPIGELEDRDAWKAKKEELNTMDTIGKGRVCRCFCNSSSANSNRENAALQRYR